MAQPILMHYAAGDETLEVSVHYAHGLEGAFRAGLESGSVSVYALDPLWTAVHDTATSFTTKAEMSVSYIIGRVGGAWAALGNAGTSTVRTITIAPNRDVYVGGSFTNWAGLAAADYVARWNGSAWAALGTGLTTTGGVTAAYDAVFDAAGNYYVVGAFLDAGGVAAADYIAMWDGSAWNAVGTPNAGATITNVMGIAIDAAGDIYVAGTFQNLAGIANADYIARWNGSAWNAVGVPLTGAASITSVDSLAIDPAGNVYVSGNFTNWADVAAADYIAVWDGSAWGAVGTGLNSVAYALSTTAVGDVYATGAFTTAGGTAANYIAKWNGSAWSALGSGLNANGRALAFTPDGTLLVGGNFTTAGGLTLPDRVAQWSGTSWMQLDVNLPGSPSVFAIAVGETVAPGYDLYLGFNTAGTATVANTTVDVTNGGSAPTFPRIVIKRVGGTTATLETITNETSGKRILADLGLLDGETVALDLRPGKKSVVSDYRGNLLGKILPLSDFATWCLLPGAQDISVLVSDSGSPTVTVDLVWRERYWSADDSVVV